MNETTSSGIVLIMPDQDAHLSCPACGKSMNTITHDSVTFDRCDGCGGLWFDLLEHRHLRNDIEDPAAVDIKPAPPIATSEADQLHAALRRCPRCNVQMTRLKDVDRRDVIYDYCAACNGTFFEAGEFRRYAKKSFIGALLERIGL